MRLAARIGIIFLSLGPLTGYGYAGEIQKIARETAEACPVTPAQMEGPYYPPQAQLNAQMDKDSDLTQLSGQPGTAKGLVLYVMGQIRDARCRPIEGAVVEIWQASVSGRYRHPQDTQNPAPLDLHFQYWGKYITGKDGRYIFKTIKPGAYPIGPRVMRPPHIHFKVSSPELGEFITQMYFAGDEFQEQDPIFNKIPASERNKVVVTMEQPGSDYERDARICRFDVTLPPSGKLPTR